MVYLRAKLTKSNSEQHTRITELEACSKTSNPRSAFSPRYPDTFSQLLSIICMLKKIYFNVKSTQIKLNFLQENMLNSYIVTS